jgi:hypothetical protein
MKVNVWVLSAKMIRILTQGKFLFSVLQIAKHGFTLAKPMIAIQKASYSVEHYARLFYGIEFTFDQVKHMKDLEEVKECAKDIKCNDMRSLWSSFGLHYACAFGFDSPEEDYSYILGEEIEGDLTPEQLIQKIDKEKIIADIKNDCKRFKLKYKKPKIICRAHTY